MGPFDNSVGAAAFWLFVGAICVVGTVLPYFKHRETQRTIRAAIDKGQSIDPALLAEPAKKDKAESYLLYGVIMIAVGLGMQAMGYAVTRQAEETIYPVFAVGIMIGLIGLALLGFGRWKMKRRGPGAG